MFCKLFKTNKKVYNLSEYLLCAIFKKNFFLFWTVFLKKKMKKYTNSDSNTRVQYYIYVIVIKLSIHTSKWLK